MQILVCDQCKAAIEGYVEKAYKLEEEIGAVIVNLDNQKDWCVECARKTTARLLRAAWDECKAVRKPKGKDS